MKRFSLLLTTGILAFGCPIFAHADEASKAAKIEEMLALTHADRIMDQMMAQMQPIMAQQLQRMDLPEDARPAAEEMQKRLLQSISQRLSWDKMRPIYVKIYSETLTEEEISGAVEFYKTPAGQAMLNKMPILIQKSMALTQQMMGDLIPEITKMGEELSNKYKKK